MKCRTEESEWPVTCRASVFLCKRSRIFTPLYITCENLSQQGRQLSSKPSSWLLGVLSLRPDSGPRDSADPGSLDIAWRATRRIERAKDAFSPRTGHEAKGRVAVSFHSYKAHVSFPDGPHKIPTHAGAASERRAFPASIHAQAGPKTVSCGF
jgi:hypothetical protein